MKDDAVEVVPTRQKDEAVNRLGSGVRVEEDSIVPFEVTIVAV